MEQNGTTDEHLITCYNVRAKAKGAGCNAVASYDNKVRKYYSEYRAER